MKIKGAIRWRLKVVMDRCHIKTVQLAAFMNVSTTTICKLRQAEFLPEISERRYIQIYNAINELCDINRTPHRKIMPFDLIEFCPDEVRDLDLDFQNVSANARKKTHSNGGKKSESEIAA